MRDAFQPFTKNIKSGKWTEIVDGVTVVHTGMFRSRSKGMIRSKGITKHLGYEWVGVYIVK